MMEGNNRPVLVRIHDSLFEEKRHKFFVLRLDLIHPFISGNKFYKLKYNIEEFRKSGKKFLVTFGGAYSNHIVATAAAGKENGINTIGVIRGEELNLNSNDYLRFAASCGMKLVFVPREEYRKLNASKEDIEKKLNSLLQSTGPLNFEILPEGGSNELAVKGCKEIVSEIPIDFDIICCACGTGATLAGISFSLDNTQQAIGISVLHGESFLERSILEMNGGKPNFRVFHEYHFGGYAKTAAELDGFCKEFSEDRKITIEPVYTGKLFYGISDLIKKDFIEPEKTIIAVHSGGVLNFQAKSY